MERKGQKMERKCGGEIRREREKGEGTTGVDE